MSDESPSNRYAIGIGMSSHATIDEITKLVDAALAEASVSRSSVHVVATRQTLRADPRIATLGWPVVGAPDAELALVVGATPSVRVADAITTASVCEAAALLAAGTGARLILAKQRSAHATIAIASAPDNGHDPAGAYRADKGPS